MGVKQNVPYLRQVLVATPAAGAEWVITGPGQGLWRVVSVAFTLTTDATVANRGVVLVVDDGTTVIARTGAGAVQAASLTQNYGAAVGTHTGAAGTALNVPLHNPYGVLLQPGWRLRTETVNLQAGDQYSAIAALVEEFPNGPGMEWQPTVDRAEYERS